VPKCLTRNISATMRDRGVVSTDHL